MYDEWGADNISTRHGVGITFSKRTGAIEKPPTQNVMLRIPTDDIHRARRLAATKGLGYQTYMKMLLRQGLDREEKIRAHA